MGEMDYLFVYKKRYNKNYRGIYKLCKNCEKLFFVSISQLKQNKGIYCSHKCAGEFRKQCVIKYCKYCGKEIITINSRIERKKFCSKDCYSKWQSEHIRGKHHPNWNKENILKTCPICGNKFYVSEYLLNINRGKYCSKQCFIESYTGENNWCWNGGVTSLNKLYRTSSKYADWRTSCMARDNFTCQKCGKKDVMLNVHHIKTVKDIFKEYNIKTRNDYMNCDELWDLNNGITLCESCHRELHFGKMDDIDDFKCND